MSTSVKSPATRRSAGGPGSSHQDATEPEVEQRHGPEPRQRRTDLPPLIGPGSALVIHDLGGLARGRT
jgi:hypothetical protein